MLNHQERSPSQLRDSIPICHLRMHFPVMAGVLLIMSHASTSFDVHDVAEA
jgi:hypothetical protein